MSKPPFDAFERVKKYCQRKKGCSGCPLFNPNEIGGLRCARTAPAYWYIRKEKRKVKQNE